MVFIFNISSAIHSSVVYPIDNLVTALRQNSNELRIVGKKKIFRKFYSDRGRCLDHTYCATKVRS